MRRDWLFWVVLAWAIIFGIAMARAETYPTHDRWGNKYPSECRRDLSYLLDRVEIKRNWNLGHWPDGRKTIGYWWRANDKSKLDVIFVDKIVTNKKLQEEVIHHELCHAAMYWLYGNPTWHKE